MSRRQSPMRRLAGEDGFAMIFALLALFVSALLVAAALSAASGDVRVTHRVTVQEKAYYAALAGVDRYQYQLTSSPEYWTKCPTLGSEATPLKVTGATDENYYVKTLGSTGNTCESGKQATILETGGSAAKGTFRILSTGTVKEGGSTVTRRIVATFAHPGFTKYVYESNYEVEDPVNFGLQPSVCEFYYASRVSKGLTNTCPPIQFAPEDKVNGPMHTNDAAEVCNSPTFGRPGYSDEIEMNGGHYAAGGCSNSPSINGKYTESAGSVLPPATDVELLEAAGQKFEGRTEIELKAGNPNTMSVTKPGEPTPKILSFPTNGVVYVENSKSEPCAVTNYTPFNTDTTNDKGCGNVYVHGTYTESLTIASADDVIVNGNLTTTESGGEPTGSATLGLIAENFVRVYHPVKQGYTTTHIEPAISLEPPRNGKCVTAKEVAGKVLRSTEVSEVTTTGLEKGQEVEGTVAGMLESGTTIAEVKASENKIKLSKAAKPTVAKELSGKFTNGSTEVKEINTTGLLVGQEVEGTGIEAGTTITEIKASEKKIKLSKAAKSAATEAAGKILKSTEVKEINTTGLEKGQEVEGPAGKIEAGTTITEVKASEKKIVLSKAAKPTATVLSGKTTNGSTEVKEITTTGLFVGEEVEGAGIVAGTTITEIKAPATEKKIKLSKAATKSETASLKFYPGETVALKFYGETTATLKFYGEATKLKVWVTTSGYAYNSALEKCHKVEGSPYNEYRESENLYVVKCEEESEYTTNAFCKYENNSGGCTAKASNMNATEDPNHWGSLENLVVDAAILSTNHSWIVDNYKCGEKLGKLTVWGSIAQFWRGPVGTGGGSGTGYIKSYNYDNRLADQQPPSFLAPTNASSWKVSRETAPPVSFTG